MLRRVSERVSVCVCDLALNSGITTGDPTQLLSVQWHRLDGLIIACHCPDLLSISIHTFQHGAHCSDLHFPQGMSTVIDDVLHPTCDQSVSTERNKGMRLAATTDRISDDRESLTDLFVLQSAISIDLNGSG